MAVILAAFTTEAQGLSVADTVEIPTNYKPEFRRERNHDLINADKEPSSLRRQCWNLFNPQRWWRSNSGSPGTDQPGDKIQFHDWNGWEFDHRLKVNYLHGLENPLKYFNQTGGISRNIKM